VQEVVQVVIVPRLQFKQTLTHCDMFCGLYGLWSFAAQAADAWLTSASGEQDDARRPASIAVAIMARLPPPPGKLPIAHGHRL